MVQQLALYDLEFSTKVENMINCSQKKRSQVDCSH